MLMFTPHMGSNDRTVLIDAQWREGGEKRSKNWTVTLHH